MVCTLAAPGAALACHQQGSGEDSEDGGEIRWEEHTTWDDARSWGQASWNGLNPIDIVPDDVWHTNDLDWYDFSDKYGPPAYWEWNSGFGQEDIIRLNNYFMNGYSTTKRRHVATHELGHALGITNFTGSTYSGQVMYAVVNSVIYLQSHDKTDYHERWGY